jgi:hypothetical protein
MIVAGPPVRDVVVSLGYPPCGLRILGVWKVAGGVALLWPGRSVVKEWPYAGVVVEVTSAAASHLLRRHGLREVASAVNE